MDFLDQISDGLKPKEVFEFMRGNMDDFEFSKISTLVKDPKMKLILDDELIKSVSETCSELVDLDLIDEIEEIYDNREPVGVLCENLGLNYGLSPYPDVKTLAEELAENYDGMSEEDIADIMQDLLDNIKDSVSDAMGKAGNVDLPFSNDPDSFMPSPSDIPAMDYANDVVLDAIFDPISKEYKREAATYSDNFFISRQSQDYVQMYRAYGDGVVKGYDEDSGDLIIEPVEEDYMYNQDFENYYKNKDVKLYFKNDSGDFEEFSETAKPAISLVTDLEDPEQTQYGENKYFFNGDERNNIYVRKDEAQLSPPSTEIFDNLAANDYALLTVRASRFAPPEDFVSIGSSEVHYLDGIRKLSSGGSLCESLIVYSSSFNGDIPSKIFEEAVRRDIKRRYGGIEYEQFLNNSYGFDSVFVSLNEFVGKKLISAYANSDSLTSQGLNTMIIDSEDIDLLEIELIKNDAKREYNDSFSFSSEENHMSIASRSGMVRAKLKLYVIETILSSALTLFEYISFS